MDNFFSQLTKKTYDVIRTIPTAIWAIIIAPAVAISGTEIQKFLDTKAYPEIDKSRINVLDGRWGGYGIQPVTEDSSIKRLHDKQLRVDRYRPNTKIEADIKDCTNKTKIDKLESFIVFPAHLSMEAKRTSFLSRKMIYGTLEITPQRKNEFAAHESNFYTITGRLEQHGDYIRLDYVNTDQSKKEFGTILLEYNSDGKLCGKFVSYGPVSRGIVQGDYVFEKEKSN
jgi:hypothetical protein